MNQLRCISRSGLRVFYCEKAAFEPMEKWYTHEGHATFSNISDCDYISIDGGGSVFINEPVSEFEANGVKFKIYTRHMPEYAEELRNKAANKIDGCVIFTGFPNALYVVTTKTRDALVKKLDELYEAKKDEIYALQDKLANAWKDAGGAYLGKCSCQSGQLYKVCCGNKN